MRVSGGNLAIVSGLSNENMGWCDSADLKAWPIGVAVFILAGAAFLAAGMGWWSVLTTFAFECAALDTAAARARRRARCGGRERTPRWTAAP